MAGTKNAINHIGPGTKMSEMKMPETINDNFYSFNFPGILVSPNETIFKS